MGNTNHTFLSALPLRYTIPGALVIATVIVVLFASFQNVRRSEAQLEHDVPARDLTVRKAIARKQMADDLVGFMLPLAGFGGLLFVLSHLVITRRATKLAAAARRLAAGDTQARAELGGGDELAKAGAAFDEMAAQISASQRILAESEARFRLMADSAPVMIWMAGVDGRCHYFNKAWLDFTGRTLEQEQGDGWTQGVHPDDLKECLRTYSQSFDARRPFVREYRLRRYDGSHGRIEDRGVPLYDAEGRFAGYIGSSVEVTARWRAETTREALLNLATKLGASLNPRDAARTIFAAADQLWAWDAGVLDIYSPRDDRTQTVLGLDIVDGHRREIRASEAPSEPTPRTRRILKQGGELILRQPPFAPSDSKMFGDTARLSASIMSVPVRWQGQSVGILSIQSYTPFAFNDEDLRVLQGLADECGGALQRIRDAEALRISEERFRELALTIDEVFWVGDPTKNQVYYVSPAYAKIWGRSCESLYAEPRSWLDAIHLEDRERILQAATTRQATSDYDEEYRIVRPDGEVRWIRDRAFPVRGQNGSVVRIVGVARDVTQRKALEEQIRQSQKLEAVGQLAAGIAHDFNNILAAVLGNTQLALSGTGLSPSAGECLSEIEKSAVRARGLIQQILAFSRQHPPERKVMALGPLVHEVAGLLRATFPSSIEISVTIDDKAPPVLADPTQMHQVLVNLCTNAWHSLEDKPGCIEIKLQAATLDSAAARTMVGLKSGGYARLCVSDNGKGMDSNTLKHIFEPFFTTKQPGKGTGLGLSVVHGIIRDHDGVVTVSSQPGHGALFEVYLPDAGVATHQSAEPGGVPRRGQGQCVLYLDDETALVHLTTRMLNRLGYQALGFTNSTDALRAFGENPDRIDLVITDLNMPGASGLEVAADFLKVRPDVPVVLISGHFPDDLRLCASKAGIRDILYKPITIEEFGDCVHGLVGKNAKP